MDLSTPGNPAIDEYPSASAAAAADFRPIRKIVRFRELCRMFVKA